jgi:Right handed beta helix region
MSRRNLFRTALAFVATLLLSATANAGLFRAYLSVSGNDANPCTLPAPCRLLPAALAAVASGGEIWMLDSANYNTTTVTIAQPVTILAVPGALGSVVATGGGDGIAINGANAIVTLRNLVFVNLFTSANGIEFVNGIQLTVEDCEISNMGNDGIHVSAGGNSIVTVKNTVLRDNSNHGFAAIGSSNSTLNEVHLVENLVGVYFADGAQGVVNNSTLAGNGSTGAVAESHFGMSELTSLIVRNSTISGSLVGMEVISAPGGNAVITSDANLHANLGIEAFFFGGTGGAEVIFTGQNNTLVNIGVTAQGGSLTSFGGI